MIVFAAICALLIVPALVFVLAPLRHPDRITVASTETQANLDVYRRQLAEMASDFGHGPGTMADDELLSEREELEHRLIVDLPDDARVARKGSSLGSEMVGPALAVGIAVSAILLYLMLGARSFLVQLP